MIPVTVKERAAELIGGRNGNSVRDARMRAVCEYLISEAYLNSPIDDAAPIAWWALTGEETA